MGIIAPSSSSAIIRIVNEGTAAFNGTIILSVLW